VTSFLADQFGDYPRVHGNRTNLMIHAVAVPLFDLAVVGTLASVAARSWVGAVNALTRIFAEQFITFPRFVLSGGWGRAYRAAGGLSDRGGP